MYSILDPALSFGAYTANTATLHWLTNKTAVEIQSQLCTHVTDLIPLPLYTGLEIKPPWKLNPNFALMLLI